MRITKTIAEEVANRLVEKLDLKLKQIDSEFAEIYYSEAVKCVPKEIMDVFEKHPKWIHGNTSGYLNYSGRHLYVSGSKLVPNLNQLVVDDPKVCNRIEKLINLRIDIKKKRTDIFKEVVLTLQKLGTYARVSEKFPEATEYLPAPKMEIALNITGTRDKLNSIK